MKNLIGLGLVLLFAAGCGDLFMSSKDKSSVDIQAISCTLDTEAFSNILSHNIKSDILCLQDSVHTFIELVETDRPGYISENVLTKFIDKGPIDFGDDDVVSIVGGIFDLTKLLLGGDRGYISKPDFDRLISFLIEFNRNIFPIHEIFQNDHELTWADYDRNRKIVRKHLIIIADELRLLLNLNRANLDFLDISKFVDRFFTDDPKTSGQIKSLMFLKRLFLGGTFYDLSHIELEDALIKLPELGEVAYDLVKIQSFGFKENAQVMVDKVYLKDISTVQKNMYFDNSSYEALFTVEDIVDALEKLEIDFAGIKFSKYIPEIKILKKVIFGSGGEFFSTGEMYTALYHLTEILEEGSLFFRVYEMYQDELNSRGPLTTDFSGFPTKHEREKDYLKNFSKIANDYRFFKGTAPAPFYSFGYYRNPVGIFEIGAFEYLIKLVMIEYGQPSNQARGGYHMTLEETANLINDFRVFLKDQGIINIGKAFGGEVQGVADNMVLMSTLFQYQSDGCDDYVCMEVPELNEFLLGLLTALNVKDFFSEKMKEFCSNPADLDAYGRFSPNCFRENFTKVLDAQNPEDNGRAISDYMPQLRSYINELTGDLPSDVPATDSEAYLKFITETEAFTRTCEYYDQERTDPVYMSANDAFAVFAGMLNIESTLLRFDANQNNKLDGYGEGEGNEVYQAYNSTYKGAIQALVEQEAGSMVVRFSYQIFQYLIKYGKVPETSTFGSTLDFIKFLIRFNKQSDASRATVASILKVLGEQNAGDNYFKCEECLRHPNEDGQSECTPVTCHESDEGELECEENPWI